MFEYLRHLLKYFKTDGAPTSVEAPQDTIPINGIPQFPGDRLVASEAYLGLSETKDHVKLKELLGMDPRRESWCAAFVTSIERELGRKGMNLLSARSYLNYGEKVLTPQPGDIVVFWRESPQSWKGHVAFYVKQDDKRLCVLGGNQDDSVSYAWYPKARLLGYRR